MSLALGAAVAALSRSPRLIVLAVVLALAAGGAPAHASGLYVALGDSVAAGGGATDELRGSYVARLFGILRSRPGGVSEWSNRAEVGATSGSVLTGSQLPEAIADIDAPSDTRLVTIDIGGNDYFGSCLSGWTDPGCHFAGNFATIVDDLQSALARDPGPEELVAMAYYNPASGKGPPEEPGYDQALLGSDLKIDCSQSGDRLGLNDLIICISSSHGALSADVYPTFKARGQALMHDSLHPNDEGHAAIARDFCLVLTSVPDSGCPASPGPLPASAPLPLNLPPAPPAPAATDTAGPSIAIRGLRGTRGHCTSHSFTVRIRARDPSGIRRVAVYLDGRRRRATRSSSRLRVRIRAGRLRPGRHRLTVLASDRAGNRARRTLRFRRCRQDGRR